jgi:hypothetical protein
MQKILTLCLFEGREKGNLKLLLAQLKSFKDKVEVIYHPYEGKPDNSAGYEFFGLEVDNFSRFANLSLSLAKGKYFLCTNADLSLDESGFAKYLEKLQKCNASAVAFEKQKLCGLIALKTAEAKKVTQIVGKYDFIIYLVSNTMLTTRSIERVGDVPFKVVRSNDLNYYLQNFEEFAFSLDKFCKLFSEQRTKLTPTAYKITLDTLVDLTVKRYICSIFLCAKGKLEREKLLAFDSWLKDITPFIYIGAEKAFDLGNLKALREGKFEKIPFLTKLAISRAVKDK